MNWKKLLYRYWIGLVDHTTFALVNLFQHRHHLQATSPEQLKEYLSQWQQETIENFYAPADIQLPADFLSKGGRLAFQSPISSEFTENNQCVVEWFPTQNPYNQPVMIMLHGLMSVSARGWRKWSWKISRCGWNAMFVHLPYHYDRCPKTYVSGELAVSPHGIRTMEGVRQAVIEIRSVIQQFKKLGLPFGGCWGMSYGGWIAALLAASDSWIRSAILLEPIVDFEHAAWDSPASVTMRQHLTNQGITRELVRDMDRLISPKFLKPLCNPDQVLVLAAEFDRVITPEILAPFAQAWGSRYRCYPQGHVGYRLMREAFREWNEEIRPITELNR